eukprot:1881358-Prorocentrum_lima.AAC.1
MCIRDRSSSTPGARIPGAHQAPRIEDIPIPQMAQATAHGDRRQTPEVQLPQWWLRRLAWWHNQATQLAEDKRKLTVELAQARAELQTTREMYANLEPGAAQMSAQESAMDVPNMGTSSLQNSRAFWKRSAIAALTKWYALRRWSKEHIRENAELRDHLEVAVEVALDAVSEGEDEIAEAGRHMWCVEVANASLPDNYYQDIMLDPNTREILGLLTRRQRL